VLRPRREGSVRRYDDRDRLHLKMILKGKLLGFTLAEINDILAGRGEENGKAELELKLTPGQIAAQISHLEQQRSRIEEAITAQRRLLEVPQSSKKRSDRSPLKSGKRFAPGHTIKLESRARQRFENRSLCSREP
jgi:DNA-binding transcriptional MerR regulator